MVDVLSESQRRLNMSHIRGKDTKPEMLVRKGLHARGRRFRLHRRDLPGSPDLVFSGFSAVVFVHGCFWHGHDCQLMTMPSTRTEFWSAKLAANSARDRRAVRALRALGWRVLTIWECSLRGRRRLGFDAVIGKAERFLVGRRGTAEITGRKAIRASRVMLGTALA